MLGWNSFSWGQALLRREECSGIFQNCYCYPLHAGSTVGDFLWYSKDLVWEQHSWSVEVSMAGFPGVFYSLHHLHWTSNSMSFIAQVFLLQHWSLWTFLLMSFCSSRLWFSVSAHLSLQIWGQQFALWPHFSVALRRVVDVSICSAFYLFLGWSGYFFSF